MYQFNAPKVNTLTPKMSVGILIAGMASFIFLSPKWLVPICAWTGPAALLIFVRFAPCKRKWLWVLGAFVFSNMPAYYEVVPIPGTGLIVFVLLNSLLSSIPYFVDKAITSRHKGFAATLAFPVSFIAIEFFSSNGPWGVWNSLANTQFSFPWLAQLASVTGIWGISFMFYWFASFAAWMVYRQLHKTALTNTVFIYPIVFFAVIIFGAIRYNTENYDRTNNIKAAGITVPNVPVLEAMYADVYGKELHIPQTASPVSPALQEANRAMLPFIEEPDSTRFKKTLSALSAIYDSLFILSKKAVMQGAKIIEWSEGSVIIWKQGEQAFLERAQSFAKQNQVDLLVAIASVETGKITAGKKFMENKAVYIDHNGNILHTLYKNKPVPGIEPCKPGDGKIPLIQTVSGPVSTSICYDADFPGHMQQLGKQRTGLLLLPSGDWRAISPYHTYAAIFRAIENGCSIMRQVSGGLSVAADYRGKITGSLDFFTSGDKMWMASIPVMHVNTIYNYIGDSMAYLCISIFFLILIYLTMQKFNSSKRKHIIPVQKQHPGFA